MEKVWIVCIYNNGRISLTPYRSKYRAECKFENMIVDLYLDVTSDELNGFVDDGYYVDEELDIVISLHQERIVYGLK